MNTPQRTPRAHRVLDAVSGAVLLAMTVFAPWALGTTEAVTIRTMNAGGFLLGFLLAAKWVVRARTGYRPPRWGDGAGSRWPGRLLALFSVAVLAYVLVGAVNRRADIEMVSPVPSMPATEIAVSYRDAVTWLPHSYDGTRSLRAFWKYLAMACAFWAARDWLLGKSRHERRLEDDGLPRFPTDRVARLLWTLTLSAGALSLAGILQRLDGTAKLLWIFRSPNLSDVNFGPYPYRGNAAQFLNLMWPLALGFWWALRDRAVRRRGVGRRAGGEPHVVLLPLAGLIAAGNFLTASRGGVLILAALLPAALLVLLTARGTTMLAGSLLVATVVAMVAAGWFLGGNKLLQRFATVGDDKLGGREPVYESAARMEKDFRVWGSGAETFAPLLHLYRKDPNEQWHAYAHDDYLETRITFGLAGFGLILALLVLAPVTSVLGPGIPATREFILLLLVAMGGILVHARFDLPFQIYSLHFEFVALSALLSCVNGVSRARTA